MQQCLHLTYSTFQQTCVIDELQAKAVYLLTNAGDWMLDILPTLPSST